MPNFFLLLLCLHQTMFITILCSVLILNSCLVRRGESLTQFIGMYSLKWRSNEAIWEARQNFFRNRFLQKRIFFFKLRLWFFDKFWVRGNVKCCEWFPTILCAVLPNHSLCSGSQSFFVQWFPIILCAVPEIRYPQRQFKIPSVVKRSWWTL